MISAGDAQAQAGVVGVARQLDGTVLDGRVTPRRPRCNARVASKGDFARAGTCVSQTRPVAPAESLREAAELLGELLAVPSEGWHALAAAMSQELFDGLKRWHAACLAKNRPVVSERHPVIACVARWWVRS